MPNRSNIQSISIVLYNEYSAKTWISPTDRATRLETTSHAKGCGTSCKVLEIRSRKQTTLLKLAQCFSAGYGVCTCDDSHTYRIFAKRAKFSQKQARTD